jgi:hypothetical protein
MSEFVASEIKNNIAEITFGTPKSNSFRELFWKNLLRRS